MLTAYNVEELRLLHVHAIRYFCFRVRTINVKKNQLDRYITMENLFEREVISNSDLPFIPNYRKLFPESDSTPQSEL
jgi:hypothetical protein